MKLDQLLKIVSDTARDNNIDQPFMVGGVPRDRIIGSIGKVSDIKDMKTSQVMVQRGLVDRIDSLNPNTEALIVRAQLIPGRFFKGVSSGAEAARKCYKHGDLIALSQPETQQQAYACNRIPLAIRKEDFSKLQEMKEDEINFQGYSFRPVQGRDRRKRVVHFTWLPEATRLFAYAENMTYYKDKDGVKKGIQVVSYTDARRVAFEGATILCMVPSRTRKKQRYKIRVENVPVEGVTERRAIVLGLKSDFEVNSEHSEYNIRYTWENDREGSDIFTFYPHDTAAYIAIAGHFWRRHNLTPMEMNPFALPSRHQTRFYMKLENNILVVDPSLSSKDKLRKLYLAEKSILLARAIGKFGHDDFSFWSPERDGKLKDYNWDYTLQ